MEPPNVDDVGHGFDDAGTVVPMPHYVSVCTRSYERIDVTLRNARMIEMIIEDLRSYVWCIVLEAHYAACWFQIRPFQPLENSLRLVQYVFARREDQSMMAAVCNVRDEAEQALILVAISRS